MAARSQSVTILRNLYRELRPTVNAPQKHVHQTQLWKYIVGLCRDCRNFTPGEVALVKKNLESTGRSYLFYLQAAREYHRISDEYKGVGERTAEDTAKMLGFKMPNEPKESKPVKSPVESVSSHSAEFSSEHTNISKNARDSRIV